MKILIWIISIVLQCGLADSQQRQWPVHVTTACYGLTSTFLYASCERGKHIIVKNVYANAKPRYTNCPEQSDEGIDIDPNCCICSPEDCQMEYSGVSKMNYYTECNGKQRCFPRVSWQPIGNMCSGRTFLLRSNYMVLEYYCVDDQNVMPELLNNTEISHNKITNNFNPIVSTVSISLINDRVLSSSSINTSPYRPVTPSNTNINRIPKFNGNGVNSQTNYPFRTHNNLPTSRPNIVNNPAVSQNQPDSPTNNANSNIPNKNNISLNTTTTRPLTNINNNSKSNDTSTRIRITDDNKSSNRSNENNNETDKTNVPIDPIFVANYPNTFQDKTTSNSTPLHTNSNQNGSTINNPNNQPEKPNYKTQYQNNDPNVATSNDRNQTKSSNSTIEENNVNPSGSSESSPYPPGATYKPSYISNNNTSNEPGVRQYVTTTTIDNTINPLTPAGSSKSVPVTPTNHLSNDSMTTNSQNNKDNVYKVSTNVTARPAGTTSMTHNESSNPGNNESYPEQPQYPPRNSVSSEVGPQNNSNSNSVETGISENKENSESSNESGGILTSSESRNITNDSTYIHVNPYYIPIFTNSFNNSTYYPVLNTTASNSSHPSVGIPNGTRRNSNDPNTTSIESLPPSSCIVWTECYTSIVINVIGNVKCPFNLTIMSLVGESWYPCQWNQSSVDTNSSVLFLYEEDRVVDPDDTWLKFISADLVSDVVLSCYGELHISSNMLPDCYDKISTTTNSNISSEVIPGLVNWELALIGIAVIFILTFIILGIWIAYSRKRKRARESGRFRFPGYNPKNNYTDERLVTPTNVTVRDQNAGVDIRTLPRRIAVDSLLPRIIAEERTIAYPQDHGPPFSVNRPPQLPPLTERARFDQSENYYEP